MIAAVVQLVFFCCLYLRSIRVLSYVCPVYVGSTVVLQLYKSIMSAHTQVCVCVCVEFVGSRRHRCQIGGLLRQHDGHVAMHFNACISQCMLRSWVCVSGLLYCCSTSALLSIYNMSVLLPSLAMHWNAVFYILGCRAVVREANPQRLTNTLGQPLVVPMLF